MLFAITPLQSKRSRSDAWTMFMITGDENLYLLPRERLRTEDLRSIEVAVFSVNCSAGPAGTGWSTGVCRAEERAGVTIIQAEPRCSSDEHFAIHCGEAAARTTPSPAQVRSLKQLLARIATNPGS